MQYTGFKEMLLELCGGRDLPAYKVRLKSNGGAEIYYSAPFPYQASEAYLFMPSGYWPSVHNNTMYPSDFPTDLLASMSEGTQTYTIEGMCANGQYLMVFCIDDIWYKTIYSMQNTKLIGFNEFTFEEEIPGTEIFLEQRTVRTLIDVNEAHFNDLPTEAIVKCKNINNLSTECYVLTRETNDIVTECYVRYAKTNDLPTSILVLNYDDLKTSCHVYECRYADLPTECYICAYGINDLDVSCHVYARKTDDISSEIFVKAYATNDLPFEVTILQRELDHLPTSFVLKQNLDDKLSVEFTIQKILNNYLPTNLSIKVYVDAKYIPIIFEIKKPLVSKIPTKLTVAKIEKNSIKTSFLIERHDNELNIPVDFTIQREDKSTLPVSFLISYEQLMEVVLDTIHKNASNIPTEFGIACNESKYIPTEFSIIELIKMETVLDALGNSILDIPTEFYIKIYSSNDLYTECTILMPISMEAVLDVMGNSFNDIPTEFEIKTYDNSYIPVSLCINIVNSMEALSSKYVHGGKVNIPTEIEVVYTGINDIETEFLLAPTNSMEVRGLFYRPQYSDIPTLFFIQSVSDLPTSFLILSPGSMEVKMRVFPPSQGSGSKPIVKDATGYSKTPASNFGRISDIYVGNKYNQKGTLEHYYSVLGFDITDLNIPKNYDSEYYGYNMIKSAKIRLFVNRYLEEDITVNIYSIKYDTWEEYKVDYRQMSSMPTDNLVTTVTIPAGKARFIDINVSSAFENWNKIGTTFSFLLKANGISSKSTLSFSSREGYHGPELIVDFYKYFPFVDTNELPTEVDINPWDQMPTEILLIAPCEEVLPTELDIIKYDSVYDIPTEIFIDGMVFVNKDLPTEWEMIFYSNESNIPTEWEMITYDDEDNIPTSFQIIRNFNEGCYVIII